MNSFIDRILIKINPSSEEYLSICTYDVLHGKRGGFIIAADLLGRLLTDENPVLDCDMGSYLYAYRNYSNIHFRLTWLHNDFHNDVTGYVLDFDLPIEKLQKAISGQRVHHVAYLSDEKEKARLVLSDSGNEMLKKIREEKLARHAIRRFLRDHFNYGNQEQIFIYPDSWIKGFYFQTDNGLEGGIVRHEDVVTGKNGCEYKKVYYAVHT